MSVLVAAVAGVALVLSVLCVLCLVWTVLSILELDVKDQLLDYSVGVAFYNDMMHDLKDRELTPEEEWHIIAMQERLAGKAKSLGLDFIPFERPAGVDGSNPG